MGSTGKLNLALPNWNGNPSTPFGGVRQDLNALAGTESCYNDLVNLRPVPGGLELTSPYFDKQSLTTYGSDSGFQDYLLAPYIAATSGATFLHMRNGSTRIFTYSGSSFSETRVACVYMSAMPSTSGIYGGCFFDSKGSFTADGDKFDFQILAGGATFQWRKNGGAWNGPLALTTSGTSVSLGLVYFLATSGYTPGDTWSWTRVDAMSTGTVSPGSTPTSPQSPWLVYGTDLYACVPEFQAGGAMFPVLMRLRNTVFTTVGYQKQYAMYCQVFENHLVVAVGNPASAPSATGPSTVDPSYLTTVRWSDLNNFDNFIPTLTNEADQFTVPAQTNLASTGAANYITSLQNMRNWCMIYTTNEIWRMTYVGLPDVMEIDQVATVGSILPNGVVSVSNVHYFVGRDNVYRFDGSSLETIGTQIKDWFPAMLGAKFLGAWYDARFEEVVFQFDALSGYSTVQTQVVYRVKYNWWYRKIVPNVQQASICFAIANGKTLQSLYTYKKSSTVVGLAYDYDAAGTGIATGVTPLTSSAGTQLLATAETQYSFCGDPQYRKEITGFYIDAGCSGETSTTSIAKVRLYYQATDYAGSQAVSNNNYTAIRDFWPANAKRGIVNMKTAGRAFRFRLELQDGNEAPLINIPATINAHGPIVYQTQAES